MEIVSSIVKDQLNRFIIEMGDSAMKKKIIISGIAAVLVIGSVVFCFAVKGDSTQPADVAQTVTEAVATPTIEVTQETSEEVSSEPEEAEEVPEVEVAEEPEVVEETPELEETSSEVSIVEVAETTEENGDSGVSTQKEEVSSEQSVEPKQEEVKPAETKPVETQPTESKPVQTQPQQTQPVQTQPQQTTVDAQRDAILAQMKADGAIEGIPDSNFVIGNETSNVGLQWE